MDIRAIIDESRRRAAALATDYDPVSGVGCAGERVPVGGKWLPVQLLAEEPGYASLPPDAQFRARVRHDFEFWCATCATIRDKGSGRPVPLRLNAPQRRLAALMESQRLAGLPVRVIVLKARQWGGSTLVQMYLAWQQLVRHKGWNSVICGQKRQSARAVKGMYRLLLSHYPSRAVAEGEPLPAFRNFEGSSVVQTVEGRDCQVVLGTAMNDDDVRGFAIHMAHLTEVAFWPDTPHHSPLDVLRSVNGTVPREPDTVVVIESTANGVGHFFHTEWLRACAGTSDKAPLFVPWHEIERYRSPVRDAAALWASLDDYERDLWEQGLTLEMLQWYHDKRGEAASHAAMMAEFPTTATEAFVCSGSSVFDASHLERLRQHCRPPLEVGDVAGERGSTRGARIVPQGGGPLKVWQRPLDGERYVAAVDIGGRSDNADYSVVAVLRVTEPHERLPEVVAQWRGHTDHDLLAWKAAQLAEVYNHALLVVESNTLETGQTLGESGEYLLAVLRNAGVNLYRRDERRLGFHTNRSTKGSIVNNLIGCVRDGGYIERDHGAVDEMAAYENTPNGGFAARRGHHDDILITRAIALWVTQVGPEHPAPRPVRHAPITEADKQLLLWQ